MCAGPKFGLPTHRPKGRARSDVFVAMPAGKPMLDVSPTAPVLVARGVCLEWRDVWWWRSLQAFRVEAPDGECWRHLVRNLGPLCDTWLAERYLADCHWKALD